MRQSVKDLVITWRMDNPKGTQAQCRKALSLSYPTVIKYWTMCDLPNYYHLKKQMIEQWCKDNPKGTKADCVYDLKISFPTVDKYWILNPNKKKKVSAKKPGKKPEIKEAEIISEVEEKEEIVDDTSMYAANSLFDL